MVILDCIVGCTSIFVEGIALHMFRGAQWHFCSHSKGIDLAFERPDLETKSILVNQAGFKGLGDFKNV